MIRLPFFPYFHMLCSKYILIFLPLLCVVIYILYVFVAYARPTFHRKCDRTDLPQANLSIGVHNSVAGATELASSLAVDELLDRADVRKQLQALHISYRSQYYYRIQSVCEKHSKLVYMCVSQWFFFSFCMELFYLLY